MSSPLSVIILAAGLGTRMKSQKAKVLHRAGGKALVEHVVDAALKLTAANNIFVVVGHQAEMVKAVLAPRGVRFVFQEQQKGTGHAVMICASQVPAQLGQVVVLYGDAPLLRVETLRRLCQLQAETGVAAVAITTYLDDPTGYGRIVRNEQGDVLAVVEQKAASSEQLQIREINAGIYCFSAPQLWKHLPEIQPNNPAGEYYLTDMVEILNRVGEKVSPLVVEDSTELLGINNRIELAEADRILRKRKAQELMLAGVTIEKPDTVTIDLDVQIGADTVIEPFVRITGETVIGSECHLGACSIIHSSKLEDQVQVLPFSMISSSYVETGAQIGPYARLRLENHVGAGAHIGNFVELKKTRLGRGAKAQHLAYLGDSTIGASVNIGAGTITCNYDGRAKHPTKIGEGAFIGSNSTLVAPVEIGDGAYVGAGSVITDEVPQDALALGRARQVLKEGWARKRREANVSSD
ncbi:MAG: bifunctional UDP-N-acetylglucosamine diphosphorylase/glucosamine-1-phosphate N-acetyltransferase GlmU [Bryobacteraceae bacterium]|nr:bifunctional UDP-N-acetylglucosamine diphosphorylase/glucosamine-1-phosphate N-acetyltransferase GlmU [Bryobacteraceae bacterium]MDW8377973.1 bifunctional UDP-N-acetylglucosamine diphosphorylase/glucosamine-1-phosphate N-acetyltransferase GlmU [Bryobacterales bacterium]